MKNKILRYGIFTLGLVAVLTAIPSSADEGMWVYNNLPKKTLKDKYGFEVTDAWAEHLMKSSVRFNSGGSGSFISSTGLVLTNHHVGADTLHKISTAEHNYFEEGYLAKNFSDEVKAPDLELNQLVSIEDVTEKVNAAVKPGMSTAEASLARRAAMAEIEKQSTEAFGLRSDVVTLYQGGQYHLYRYKKYTDIRLVFAPEFKIAFFGGDPDNFEFPRFDLDMCIFRVYENGQPAKIENFLKWSANGTKENELVFVSGHPGKTSRMFTVSALEIMRDVKVPYLLNRLMHLEVLLQQFGGKGMEQARRAQGELFSAQNSRKVYAGRIKGLQDRALILSKQKQEYELRSQVEANPELKALSGAWDQVTKAQENSKSLYVRRALLETGHAFNSQLFVLARHLVRMADEDLKPSNDRLPEYRDSGRASLLQQVLSDAPIYEDLEEYKLADSLTTLMTNMGENNAFVQKVLLGKSPVERAHELVANTTLTSVSVRKLLVKGGKKAIDSSYDPLILLAKSVDAASRKIRKAYEDNVDELERQGYAQIAKAMFAVQGTSTYPDATFTLRLSFGEVKGYQEGSNFISPITTIGGAFEHEAKHGKVEPWVLPQSWNKAKPQLDLSTPYNFASTADIIGGNSGSPVVNKEGELVGLIFDGNIHSLIADYFYSDKLNRSVSVHSSAMREAMSKIYGATALVSEIGK